MNNICGPFSPLKDESVKLSAGDIAKVDLGCHIDGFIAQAAHTVVVGGGKANGKINSKISGKQSDAVLAAHNALQAALRLFQAGNTNTQVTEAVTKIAESFNCNAVEGALSHKVKKHLIDGNDVIINRETPDQKVETYEFEAGDVFTIDVFVSSGEGKPKEVKERD